MKKRKFGLFHIRMILGGAIAGAALASVLANHLLGVTPKDGHDLLGALVGGGASAVWLKLAHLV